jgi:hypothetical protein
VNYFTHTRNFFGLLYALDSYFDSDDEERLDLAERAGRSSDTGTT